MHGLATERYCNVVLGIMDGLHDWEKVFQEEFGNARIQQCQVHLARNVLSKVLLYLKQVVAEIVVGLKS